MCCVLWVVRMNWRLLDSFSVGRFTTEAEIDAVGKELLQKNRLRLRELRRLWEMYKRGH